MRRKPEGCTARPRPATWPGPCSWAPGTDPRTRRSERNPVMQWLAQISVRRPIFATVLMLAVCVLGIAGYFQLGVDRFPNIDAPFITVNTRMPGASPEEIESEVTD